MKASIRTLIQEDPIGRAGGSNLYAYVGGDPMSRRDPSGLMWSVDAQSASIAGQFGAAWDEFDPSMVILPFGGAAGGGGFDPFWGGSLSGWDAFNDWVLGSGLSIGVAEGLAKAQADGLVARLVYAHLGKSYVAGGDVVKRGQTIGLVGCSGRTRSSSGDPSCAARAHLHEELFLGTDSELGGRSELIDDFPLPFGGQGIRGAGFGNRWNSQTGRLEFHGGRDTVMPLGTPIRAAMGGTVWGVGTSNTWGLYVILTLGTIPGVTR